jgi:putative SOS response-associated peptidase YedK
MCGRYYIEIDSDELERIVQEVQEKCKAYEQLSIEMKTGEVFPTDIVPVISMQRQQTPMRWGFSKYSGTGVIINARSESITELTTFRNAVKEGRCLIPASYYFEWEQVGSNKKKHALTTGEPTIYMAGLYRQEPQDPLPRFVIITRPASPSVAHIHDRMPVILPKAARRLWLESGIDALREASLEIMDRPLEKGA